MMTSDPRKDAIRKELMAKGGAPMNPDMQRQLDEAVETVFGQRYGQAVTPPGQPEPMGAEPQASPDVHAQRRAQAAQQMSLNEQETDHGGALDMVKRFARPAVGGALLGATSIPRFLMSKMGGEDMAQKATEGMRAFAGNEMTLGGEDVVMKGLSSSPNVAGAQGFMEGMIGGAGEMAGGMPAGSMGVGALGKVLGGAGRIASPMIQKARGFLAPGEEAGGQAMQAFKAAGRGMPRAAAEGVAGSLAGAPYEMLNEGDPMQNLALGAAFGGMGLQKHMKGSLQPDHPLMRPRSFGGDMLSAPADPVLSGGRKPIGRPLPEEGPVAAPVAPELATIPDPNAAPTAEPVKAVRRAKTTPKATGKLENTTPAQLAHSRAQWAAASTPEARQKLVGGVAKKDATTPYKAPKAEQDIIAQGGDFDTLPDWVKWRVIARTGTFSKDGKMVPERSGKKGNVPRETVGPEQPAAQALGKVPTADGKPPTSNQDDITKVWDSSDEATREAIGARFSSRWKMKHTGWRSMNFKAIQGATKNIEQLENMMNVIRGHLAKSTRTSVGASPRRANTQRKAAPVPDTGPETPLGAETPPTVEAQKATPEPPAATTDLPTSPRRKGAKGTPVGAMSEAIAKGTKLEPDAPAPAATPKSNPRAIFDDATPEARKAQLVAAGMADEAADGFSTLSFERLPQTAKARLTKAAEAAGGAPEGATFPAEPTTFEEFGKQRNAEAVARRKPKTKRKT